MGSSPISNATAGTTILASLFNKITSAMRGNIVPRNSSGIGEDASGSLGETGLHWLQAYINTMFVGATHRVKLYQDSNQFVIALDLTGGGTYTEVARFTSTGISAAAIATDLISPTMIASYTHLSVVDKTATGTHVVNASAKNAGPIILVQACGGGGGGGGGASTSSPGGGGGSGAPVLTGILPVIPGASVSITIGGAGSGGASGGATGSNGVEGDATIVSYSGITLTFPGGLGGTGANAGNGGAGGLSRNGSTTGGRGGDAGAGGSAGGRSQYGAGAAGGATSGGGGGGGGAGAGFATGGVGGDGGSVGASGASNSGGGGGGGGGGASPGAGGSGGSGLVRLMFTSL